jgi:hypothetical protein
MSRISSSKHPSALAKPCVKVKLQPEFSRFILDDPLALGTITRKLYNIRKYWLLFHANLSYFGTTTHEVCIENYTVADGMMVLAVAALASQGLSAITVTSEFPFLIFKGEFDSGAKEMIKAWTELGRILELIISKKIGNKLEGYLKALNEFVAGCEEEKKKYVMKAVKKGNELVKEIEETKSRIKQFTSGFEECRERVIGYAEEAKNLNEIGGKQIVHFVLRKTENNI